MPPSPGLQAEVSADKQYLGPVVAGMVAGTASSLIRVPTEVVKQRLQTGEFKGAITAVRAGEKGGGRWERGGGCKCQPKLNRTNENGVSTIP